MKDGDNMSTSDIWELVEGRMLELRILTEANWKNSEWELAALGERVLKTVDQSRIQSEAMHANAQDLQISMNTLAAHLKYQAIFADQARDTNPPPA
jgi:hypothetical protein